MSIKRLNYFKGEFLNKEDFEEEQNYHVSMLREHNENLHTGGIAAGLEVPSTFEDGTNVIGSTDIFIKKGMAIDDLGREIVLTENKQVTASTIIPANSTNTKFDLVIYYYEEPTDKREDNPGKLENTRIKEEPVITFVENVLSNDPKKPLKLATIILDSNKKIKNIDLTGRQYASSIIADKSIVATKIDNGAVGREHLNSDIFNNLLISPDGTIGIQADVPSQTIKLTSQVSTGLVEFPGFTPSVQNVSGLIDPGFGPGPISVILGLDETHTSNNQVFIGTAEASGFFNLPDVLIGALVDVSTGKFRVGMSVRGAATPPIRVRWWAFKPGQDKGTQIVVSVSIDPFSSSLRPGRTQQFSAIVSGTDNKAVTWSVKESNGGSITNTGLYTAPITTGIYHIVATSQADATKSGLVAVTVTEDIAISIAPATASVFVGHQQQFTAIVTGTSFPGVTWKTSNGTIDASGLYTAPQAPGTYTVQAISQADTTKIAEAKVEVKPEIAVTISPADVNLFTGRQQQFKATVTGSTDTGVIWSIQEGPEGGTIDGTGLYTAPSGMAVPVLPPIISPIRPGPIPTGPTVTPITSAPSPTPIRSVQPSILTPGVIGTYHVVATSKADPTKKAVANITVTLVTVSISPAQVTVTAGKTQQFTSTVQGVPNTGVLWTVPEGQAGGAVTAAGLYTAPATPGTYHVVATSVENPSKTATATITVVPIPAPVSISISPANVSLPTFGQQQFTPVVTGTNNTAVKWSILEIDRGSITNNGTLLADKKTMTVGETWDIGGGWTLTAQAIDAKATPRQVWLLLSRNGDKIEDKVLAQGDIYNYYNIINAKIDSIFAGVLNDMVQLTGVTTNVASTALYTAPGTPGTYHVIATSVADSTKTATATITVTPNIFVSINPASTTVEINKGTQFSAGVSGTTNTAVTWRVQESAGGSISTTGLYTAPGTAGTYHVIATSVADSTKTATAVVTVTAPKISIEKLAVEKLKDTDKITKELEKIAKEIETGGGFTIVTNPVSVSINPTSATVNTLGKQQFNANIPVNWKVTEAGGGTISNTGLYTAPSTPGTYHVVATSISDPTKTATATVTVNQIKTTVEKLADKVGDKTRKEIEKIAKEIEIGGGFTPIMNPGPITYPDGGSTFNGEATGRAFIRPDERHDVGTINQPK